MVPVLLDQVLHSMLIALVLLDQILFIADGARTILAIISFIATDANSALYLHHHEANCEDMSHNVVRDFCCCIYYKNPTIVVYFLNFCVTTESY